MSEALLSVRDLVVEFDGPRGPVRVVDGVSFDVGAGEVLGIVGESGSGKSVSLLAVMGLLPAGARIAGGEIRFDGQRIDNAPEATLRALRGGAVSMIFQDPMTSLNPVLRIGTQIGEAIRLHAPRTPKPEVRERVEALLASVGVPDPASRARQFPHEFSGGMRQRAMIAMAIANGPRLLIADEPTTALDVTIQAQVMDVLEGVCARNHASMILVTHDLGLVAETADRIAVMYSGRVAETGPTDALFARPSHPYTRGLLDSLPTLDADHDELRSIPGQPPDMAARPPGCAFHPRCALGQGRPACSRERPDLRTVGTGHAAACHYAEEAAGDAPPREAAQ
ncbi:ABC transporter ATP-binding protein [Rhodovulum sp. 12E13]|uniref:ABC transporter ATP-binding protein n=1 Tax=Rhodovulum sp. 12E13 TaxID=2203891 RepID=UPI000E195D82|nr:ABC transporter ATP-binding protein [Rhodovulum sp. 12E13]RDC71220.1 ABC transporter ATP-binding protein [Rhodovulum sp. 12E13]